MKETAETILVVVNNQTRGIASMVEAAELIASGRDPLFSFKEVKEWLHQNGGHDGN